MKSLKLPDWIQWILIIIGGIAIIFVLATILDVQLQALYTVVFGMVSLGLMLVLGYASWEVGRYFARKNRLLAQMNSRGSPADPEIEQAVKRAMSDATGFLKKELATIKERLGLRENRVKKAPAKKQTVAGNKKT